MDLLARYRWLTPKPPSLEALFARFEIDIDRSPCEICPELVPITRLPCICHNRLLCDTHWRSLHHA